MAPLAYLLVFSEPGANVSLNEFQDWYDNEHVPLRVNTPAFQSWERWEQADGQTPTFAASYDLSSFQAMQEPPYTTLAQTRSEREKDILKRVQLLDRRTYEEYDAHPMPPPSALYDPKKSAGIIVFVSFDVQPGADDEMNRWYDEEHLPMLAKCPGWIRSRRFVLKEHNKIGGDAGKAENLGAPPKYLAVHEWADARVFESLSEEYKAATSTPWREKVMETVTSKERRIFKFSRRWDRE